MKRLLLLTILLSLGVASAQVTPDLYPDPLLERRASGPLIEEALVDGELIRTRQYDGNGFLVSERWPKGTRPRYVGTAVIKSVDTDAAIITFTGLIPEEMEVTYIHTNGQNYPDSGKVVAQDRSRFQLSLTTPASRYAPGDTVRVGIKEPYVTRYTYPLNQVVEEHLWEDGTAFKTLTYRYGRHGPVSIHEVDHQTGEAQELVEFEYDEHGNLTLESNFYVNPISNRRLVYAYEYDQQGRLTRIQLVGGTLETLIAYTQETPDVTRIELTTNSTITAVTHDHSSGTLEFATTDHTRANETYSDDLDILLKSLGISTPRHQNYPSLERFARGRITLDNQNRITQLTAYEAPYSDTLPGTWWELTTTIDDEHRQETTITSIHTEPADADYPFHPPPDTLTLTTRPPTNP